MTQAKSFSLEEANRLIPDIEKRMKKIQEERVVYLRAHDALFMHELVEKAEKEQGLQETENLKEGIHELEQTIEALAEEVDALSSMGCVVRNIEAGWVDFRGDLQGKQVYFSWKCGESSIQYYRGNPNNLKERTPLQS